ncbi:MAG: chemotaxis protein CheW [Myxococcales bacterium]
MNPSSDSARVDLAIFEIDGRIFGADALDIARVGRVSIDLPLVTRLGEPGEGARVLVVRGAEGEAQVLIDRFIGIEQASVSQLRRLPAFLRGLVEPALVGFLQRGGEIVLLIDLQALVNEGKVGRGADEIEPSAS